MEEKNDSSAGTPQDGADRQEALLSRPVQTSGGQLRGRRSRGVEVFRGIPYGAPTGGRGRFMPPSPAPGWTGEREAFGWGPSALQGRLSFSSGGKADPAFMRVIGSVFGKSPETLPPGEDCLYLNVWTPAAEASARRPVMVWLHGGGFAIGSGASDLYDGTALCLRGDVVVVTLNHRLSALGYLYLGDIGGPEFADSGNVGMLDIVLALQWVRDNIAAFGGDPGNVTIFGESGGGAKVGVLMAMPAAQGLFHKAIVQSGPALRALDRDEASRLAEATLAALGLGPGQVRELQRLPGERVIDAATQAQSAMKMPSRGLSPVVDGSVLPGHPFDPGAPAMSAGVPLLIGCNKDETALFLAADPRFGHFTDEEVAARVGALVPDGARRILDAYRSWFPGDSPTCQLVRITTDMGTWMGSVRMAERKHALAQATGGAPAHLYRLDWETPVMEGRLRAPHGLDLPLMFDNVQAARGLVGPGPEPQRVADAMSEAWLGFARTGDPGRPGLPWPAYTPQRRATMVFDVESQVIDDLAAPARRLWSD